MIWAYRRQKDRMISLVLYTYNSTTLTVQFITWRKKFYRKLGIIRNVSPASKKPTYLSSRRNMTLESGWLKSLRHVAMVAKFVDETSFKKWVWTVSNFLDRIQFLLIGQMSAKLSEVESERTVFDVRKRKRKFLRCVHQLHKAGAWN